LVEKKAPILPKIEVKLVNNAKV